VTRKKFTPSEKGGTTLASDGEKVEGEEIRVTSVAVFVHLQKKTQTL